MVTDSIYLGSCLCGAVRFVIAGELAAPDACHCTQCRKQSGHVWASTDVPMDRIQISGEEHLRWYQSSAKVRRGFCATCGSFLFWDPVEQPRIAVAMGAFDPPTNTHLHLHIFTADKGDYYAIDDGIEQHAAPP